MFKSLWSKIVAFVKKAREVTRSVVTGQWTKNVYVSTSGFSRFYGRDLLTAKTEFSWTKWFKGEYRMAKPIGPISKLRSIAAGLVGQIAGALIISNLLTGWGLLALIPCMVGSFIAGRFTQAIDLKYQVEVYL